MPRRDHTRAVTPDKATRKQSLATGCFWLAHVKAVIDERPHLAVNNRRSPTSETISRVTPSAVPSRVATRGAAHLLRASLARHAQPDHWRCRRRHRPALRDRTCHQSAAPECCQRQADAPAPRVARAGVWWFVSWLMVSDIPQIRMLALAMGNQRACKAGGDRDEQAARRALFAPAR